MFQLFDAGGGEKSDITRLFGDACQLDLKHTQKRGRFSPAGGRGNAKIIGIVNWEHTQYVKELEDMREDNFDYKEYLKLIRSDEYIALHQYYSDKTIWEITGTARRELSHSSFIKWMLDPNETHQFGMEPFHRFIESLCGVKESWYKDTKRFFTMDNHMFLSKNYDDIRMGRFDALSISVMPEKSMKGLGRADVFLTAELQFQSGKNKTLAVLIENKVESTEQYDKSAKKDRYQTEKYATYLKEQKNYDLVLPVFLIAKASRRIKRAILDREITPDKHDESLAQSEEFITYNYQNLLAEVISPILNSLEDNSTEKRRLEEYCRCLGPQSSSFAENSAIRGESVMAISLKEREWATEIWGREDSRQNRRHLLSDIFASISNGQGFILNKKEMTFWIELAKLFLYLSDSNDNVIVLDESETQTIEAVASQKKFIFRGVEYKIKSERSLGLLARDLIDDFLHQNTSTEDEWLSAVMKLRDAVRSWNYNWLRDVIIFDDEVIKIQQAGSNFVPENKKYTDSIGDFIHAFFSYMSAMKKSRKPVDIYDKSIDEKSLGLKFPLELTSPNGHRKAYVAKFWAINSLRDLQNYLNDKCDCNYNVL